MTIQQIKILLALTLFISTNGYAEEPGFMANFFSWDATYKLLHGSYFVSEQGTCSDIANHSAASPNNAIFKAGKGSVFHQNPRTTHDNYIIVEFEHVANDTKLPGNQVAEDTAYKLCTNPEYVPYHNYRRVGGVTTGLLVVPFKIRDGGDLTGDASIGPYMGFSGEKFLLMATFGLTQISTTDVNTPENDIKNETGLTAAFGINWEISSNFDVGIFTGFDHLSGSAADNFQHQDDIWYSFAIGYNFTR